VHTVVAYLVVSKYLIVIEQLAGGCPSTRYICYGFVLYQRTYFCTCRGMCEYDDVQVQDCMMVSQVGCMDYQNGTATCMCITSGKI
jgi:hypothetical protein